MKRKFPLQFLVTIAILAFSFGSQAQDPAKKSAANNSGYAPVNGLKVYYEVYGEGDPIVLLHGAYMTIGSNWGELIPELSKTRKVIAVEMQGHGHTADTDRALNYTTLASDVAGVMKHLKVTSADIVGYSFGGTIAIEVAIRHPEMVKSLTVISSTYTSNGWLPEVRALFDMFTPEIFDGSPMVDEYKKVAPDPDHWHAFVAKMIACEKLGFDLGEENVKNLKMPVLLLMGDNDGIDLNSTTTFYRMLGGNVIGDMAGLPKSQLAIIPAKTHVSLMEDTKAIFSTLDSFLTSTQPIKTTGK